MKVSRLVAAALAAALPLAACHRAPDPAAVGDPGPPVGEPVRAVLTDAPAVPPPIERRRPAKVIVELEVREIDREIAPGVTYTFWTFGGQVPGKFIRVRQGDTVELRLKNHPDNKMPHNIDLHAVTGPGGGAAASFTAPGHETRFEFKALNPGLYVYHCATAPVGMHIANGMYGLILVEPPDGLPPVDREFYVMQGDFYTTGAYREPGHQPFHMQKAIDEDATYVLFNGAEGALVGENALRARVGERVRLFVGNGGPNLVSSFHVIGEIFDRVHSEGGSRYQENVQTSLIPAGGAAIFEFRVEVPGTYTLVDHSIFRAFNKGAVGTFKVEGPERPDLFSDAPADEAGRPERPDPPPEAAAAPPPADPAPSGSDAGRRLYTSNCGSCHQAEGQGLAGVIPPLAASDYLMADKDRSIEVLLNGLKGPIRVNGRTYDSMMPAMPHLSDREIADILTYVRASWGNDGDPVTAAEVAAVRARAARRGEAPAPEGS